MRAENFADVLMWCAVLAAVIAVGIAASALGAL